ncbi:hypothetical protein QOT17_006591 [Balamuthia mandrillaris]
MEEGARQAEQEQPPPMLQGYLYKQRKTRFPKEAAFQRFFCCITDRKLCCFEREEEAAAALSVEQSAGSSPTGSIIPLDAVVAIKSKAADTDQALLKEMQGHTCFQLVTRHGKLHHFYTETVQERERWLDVLQELCNISKADSIVSDEDENSEESETSGGSAASSPRQIKGASLREGVNLLWNGLLAEAEQLFSERKEEDFHFALHYAMVPWLRAVITEEKESINEACSRLDEVESMSTPFCHYCAETTTVEFVRGFWSKAKHRKPSATEMQEMGGCVVTAYCKILRALLFFKTGAYIQGGINLRKSWKIFAECHSIIEEDLAQGNVHLLDPGYISLVQFGVAAFHFTISLLPPSLKWVVEAIGFEANRTQGIKGLHSCHDSDSIISPLATFFLLWIQIFLGENLKQARVIYEEAIHRFPKGVLFQYLGAQMLTKEGQVEQAIALYEEAYANSQQLRQMQLIFEFEIGECYAILSEWEKACQHYDAFLKENKTTAYRCWCAFHKGVAHCMLGENKEARASFLLASGYVRKHYSFDIFAGRKAKDYLHKSASNKTPFLMSDLEKALTTARLQKQGRLWGACLQTLEDCKALMQQHEHDWDSLGQYLYLKGRSLKGLGHLDEAEKAFLEVIAVKKKISKEENYVVPHAYNDLGELYLERAAERQKDKEEEKEWLAKAKEVLKKAKDFPSSYSFDKPLSRKIKKNLDAMHGFTYY